MRALIIFLTLTSHLAPTPEAWGSGEPDFPIPAFDWSPLHYSCFRTQLPPRIDGRLDDACWGQADWSEDFVDIEGDLKPAPRHRSRVKMLWDENYFYVGAEMEEPHVWGSLRDRDAVIYHDNDFEVFIDPDGDTHQYYELEINALNTVWDLLLIKPYRDGGPAVNAWDIAGLKHAVHVDGTLNDPADKDRGWSVEIALPWPVLAQCAQRPAPPAAGEAPWRVNFSRVQWRTTVVEGLYVKLTDPETGQPLPEDNWVWSPQGLINMHYPEMWGFVHFRGAREAADSVPLRVESFRPWDILPRQLYYKQKGWHSVHGAYATELRELAAMPPPISDLIWQDMEEQLHLTSDGEHFVITVTTQRGVRSIDQDGRLRFIPSKAEVAPEDE